MSATVDRITVTVSRKVRVGMGSEVFIGTTWSAAANPNEDPALQQDDLTNAALKQVNVTADRVEKEFTNK